MIGPKNLFDAVVLPFLVTFAMIGLASFAGCDTPVSQSDQKDARAQERLTSEAQAQAGLPTIHNFREKKELKAILEMRDQADFVTYTYTYAENTGKRIFLCQSIGYPIPYATQYTNPSKIANPPDIAGYYVMPQADPNGLFSPASADGTWVLCKSPNGPDVKPVYVEPRVITSPFKLDEPETEIPVTVKGK